MNNYIFPTIVCEIEDLQPLEAIEDIPKSRFIFSDFNLRVIEGGKAHEALIQIQSRELLLSEGIVVVPEPIPEKEDKFPEVAYYIQFSKEHGIQISVGQVTDVEDEIYQKYEQIGCCYCTLIVRALIFIMERIESRRKVIREVNKISKITKRKNSHSNRQNDKVFLLDELVEYVAENNLYQKSEKHNQINCPCWSVRGHYRTYKSGKKVFVKPFNKGKERGKVAPKQHTYVV